MVKYEKERANIVADMFSRLLTQGETTAEVDYEQPCFALSNSSVELGIDFTVDIDLDE